jgi:thiol-disulfide isomerase/thioredoxin
MKRVVLAALVLLTLAACSAEPLAGQYADGSGQGYISGDGAYLELPVAERADPIVFEGSSEAGETISSDDYAGKVYVVNFWYAGCPPCRAEASDLADLSAKYNDVPFLGVNIFDDASAAKTFAAEHGILYPSILDVQKATVQLAFSGSVAPNAVPTTLVMDRQGRVAGRISGLIRDPSILAAMIDRVVAEAR